MMLRNKAIQGLVLGIVFSGGIAGCTTENIASETPTASSRLEVVKARGKLVCGITGKLPGLSYSNEKGEYSGLDVDMCRAVAAALFNNPNAVEFRVVSSQERFNALTTGEIDLLAANTTWTITRDASVGAAFLPPIFYDGQGIMVKANSGIDRLEDLENKTVCVQTGTTSLLNLQDTLRAFGIDYKAVAFGDADRSYNAYLQGRCQAVTSDRSQLVGRRSKFPSPDRHLILDDVLSKEPLAPAVADGDTKWFDVVRWVVFTTFAAEEFGITSDNIDNFSTTVDPAIARFLGTEGSLGKNLGLSNDFAARIVSQVGNYGEIYQRNIGEPLGLDRGLNQLWNDGGLLYSPPFR